MTQRIRQFYQLTQLQQLALLDIVDEMLVMNAAIYPAVPVVPHLQIVK